MFGKKKKKRKERKDKKREILFSLPEERRDAGSAFLEAVPDHLSGYLQPGRPGALCGVGAGAVGRASPLPPPGPFPAFHHGISSLLTRVFSV